VRLALQPSVLKTPALALVLALVVGLGLEGAARWTFYNLDTWSPSLGLHHRQFEIEWHRLMAFQHAYDPPYCVFLGNSTVYRGIDPVVFSDSFEAEAGRRLECFTFGVQGLAPDAVGQVAEVIIHQLSPVMLIYGNDVPSLGKQAGLGPQTAIVERPWFQQQLGKWNAHGWVIQNSMLLRYSLLGHQLLGGDPQDWLTTNNNIETNTTERGFRDREISNVGPDRIPEPRGEALEMLAAFAVSPDQLAGLRQFASLRRATSLLVVESPLHPGFFQFLRREQADYLEASARLQAVLRQEGIAYLPTTMWLEIDDAGWLNTNHLNAIGAAVFSRWLAGQVAELIAHGQLVVALP